MVDPISNQQFSHDFQKFVLQDLSAIPPPPAGIPRNPFVLKSTKKTKKDLDKEKSPYEIKKPKGRDQEKPV